MIRYKLRLPKHKIIQVMREFGQKDDIFEIIDLNKDDFESRKNFSLLIKRCEELEVKLGSLLNYCEKFDLKPQKFKSYDDFLTYSYHTKENFDSIENKINNEEKTVSDLFLTYQSLNETYVSLKEKISVFERYRQLVKGNNNEINEIRKNSEGQAKKVMEGDEEAYGFDGINFISGIVQGDDMMKLSRMIFRVSKGRAMINTYDLIEETVNQADENEELKEEMTNKKVFIIFFQGSHELSVKLYKICDIYNCSRYSLPEINSIQKEINLIKENLISQERITKEARLSILNFLNERIGNDEIVSEFEYERHFLRQEKYIYSNLNKCQISENFVVIEIFTIQENVHEIRKIFNTLETKDNDSLSFELTEVNMNECHDKITTPTYIKTNEFTWVFQELVNTYGIPRYQEINPAMFNIITFPFLFGIMFGDIAHGAVLFCIGLYITVFADDIRKDENSKMKLFLPIRYLLLMMGFFSFFSGMLYNDFGSIPIPISNTCYENKEIKLPDNKVEYFGEKKKDCNYYFGIDHKWYISTNELSFVNSLKMKLSVIFGVVHMLGGIILKGLNLRYFQLNIDFIFEFIPQIIFFVFLFVYMDFLIVMKWLTKWNDLGSTDVLKPNSPSITSTVLNIILKAGGVEDATDVSLYKNIYFLYIKSLS